MQYRAWRICVILRKVPPRRGLRIPDQAARRKDGFGRARRASPDSRIRDLGVHPPELVSARPQEHGALESRGYCLEMICADFLAGANLDNEDPTTLLQSMSRFFKFLPGEQRQVFLHEVTGKAS